VAAHKPGTVQGDIIRYDPAPEPAGAAIAIFLLTILEIVFVALFCYGLAVGWNSVADQQMLSFWLGAAMLDLAAILSLYRKFFLPDVMIVKRRKLKYEDLM
jgi:hypothetical protein